jgi:hypothetical protein
MLYLRNTNQVQTLDRGIKRGVTNVCCTPTLNSVTTASLTQLNIDGTFGTYLVNCKSCVGGYIQVSEDYGSNWTTINPGNCSPTNLVPQPSQSAYYRLFTSCSAVDQPFDPLVSDYSNEIQFIPYGIVNYNFIEQPGATGLFKFYDDSELLLNASSSISGTYWEILSASYATASIQCLEVPLTGSTSMSLLVTGSGVSYYTSSCAQSGGIFLDDWKVAPHIFYDVTASLNFRPENDCTASTYSDLGYTVNSYDQTTGRWYSANEYGMPNTSSAYATLVGASTAVKTNIVSGDCRFNAIQFSGSMQLTTSVEPETREVYIAIVSGSFKLSGNNGNSPFQPWNFITAHDGNTGTIIINNDSTFVGQTTKNSLVGLGIGAYFPSSQKTALFLTVSGSSVAGNPPVLNGGPWNFGSNFTLEGEGIIRGFSVVTDGTVALQSQYNCIYETTPSK